jgi:hypothetical protein
MKYVASFQADDTERWFHATSVDKQDLIDLRNAMVKTWGRVATGFRIEEVPDDWECTEQHEAELTCFKQPPIVH